MKKFLTCFLFFVSMLVISSCGNQVAPEEKIKFFARSVTVGDEIQIQGYFLNVSNESATPKNMDLTLTFKSETEGKNSVSNFQLTQSNLEQTIGLMPMGERREYLITIKTKYIGDTSNWSVKSKVTYE